jgi:outer membrane receptor protein involved in Fe transport
MPRRVLLSAASLLAFALVAPLAPSLAQAAETPAPADAPDLNAVDKVVVTAAPYAVSLDTVTSSVNVVTRDQLDTLPAAGIGDLLNGLPGLRSTFYGPGASRPVIRGLSGPRVMVLQNGVGQVDASSLSPDHAVASDPGEASRIEVLRGPSTLAYGGSGIGGVVNMIDDRVPSSPAANGPEGRLSASVSSVDDGWAYSGAVKAGKGPIVFAADISSRRTDDYTIPTAAVSDRLAARDGLTVDPDHKVKNTDVEVDAYGAGVSWVHERGFIGASVKKTDTTYGVPYEQILAPIDPDAEGHLWAARYGNFIEEAPTGAIEDNLPVYQYFQTKADFHGAEFEGSYEAWRGATQSIRLETTFDWVHGETDAGVPARIPPWSLGGSVVWNIPRVETTLEVRRVAEQDRVATFELPTDGYTVVNLKATFKPMADSPLRLFVDGRNLTNEEIREHVSFLKDYAPSPGRSVRAGVAWKF